MSEQNYQDMPSWFVSGWFELETTQDRRNAKTLCALVARKQQSLEVLA
jgi:hypothetical protein